jgi:hypothetical protein
MLAFPSSSCNATCMLFSLVMVTQDPQMVEARLLPRSNLLLRQEHCICYKDGQPPARK